MNLARHQNYSIELDCPPGNIRPWELIEEVLMDSGLIVDDFNTGTPFFGHQTWILKEGDPEKDQTFVDNKPMFKQRVEALYEAGVIRYGSW